MLYCIDENKILLLYLIHILVIDIAKSTHLDTKVDALNEMIGANIVLAVCV